MISWNSLYPIMYDKPAFYVKGNKTADILDLNRVAKCIEKYAWSPIVFKNGHRAEENFISSDFCALDFDDGLMTLDEAMQAFCDCNIIIGTTRHHQKEKHGLICDRFRVIIPWTERITDVITYKYNMRKMQRRYPIDDKALDGARGYWPCTKIVLVQQGEDYELQEVDRNFSYSQFDSTLVSEKTLEFYRKARAKARRNIMPLNLGLWVDTIIPVGERNEACYRLARDLHLFELERDPDAVFAFIANSETYRDQEMTRKIAGEIRARIQSGFKKATAIEKLLDGKS